MTKSKTFNVKLIKSLAGNSRRQIQTVHSLGLKKIGQIKQRIDNKVNRGMLNKVSHLVKEVLDD